MLLPRSLWAGLVYVFDIVTFNSQDRSFQQPLFEGPKTDGLQPLPSSNGNLIASSDGLPDNGRLFTPPSGSEYEQIQCNYIAMENYTFCSTPGDRSCWLKGKNGYLNYTIETDYEKYYPPSGFTRRYYLEVGDASIAPDGVVNNGAKLFNNTYPGPWIQACWGDDLEITVKNNLKTNGTTVHWHGIRQHNTVEMDGVNGVTECPIPPGESFTYKFKAMQYGTSWYHSHYSLQYGDGLLGPMTIHGPSSADYDSAIRPTLMTDWGHRSAFDVWWDNVNGNKDPITGVKVGLNMDNILLNGTGIGSDKSAVKRYTLPFERGMRYLMRLINTSVDTAFVFAIDDHKITVVGADFVPIKPYVTDHVVVGIGQRYHIIIEAQPKGESSDGNYWLRTIPTDGCGRFNAPKGWKSDDKTKGWKPDDKMGVVRYNKTSTKDPSTERGTYSILCRDENASNLVPILPWKVGPPANLAKNSHFEIGLDPTSGKPFFPVNTSSRWNMFTDTMWLNFSEPTMMHINEPNKTWDRNMVVITENPDEGSWIYLLVSGTGIPKDGRFFPPAAHPIHLHGHDFAILEQSSKQYQIGALNLNLNNPPRRDVALLPAEGYLVLAFKADNPGAWLMHCHIAWHASGGLAIQILENQKNISMPMENKKAMEDQCASWKSWLKSPGTHFLQDDSGI